jgi:hypothetical protein
MDQAQPLTFARNVARMISSPIAFEQGKESHEKPWVPCISHLRPC